MFLEDDDQVETWRATTAGIGCLRLAVVYHSGDGKGKVTPEPHVNPCFEKYLYLVQAKRLRRDRALSGRAERDSSDGGNETDKTRDLDSFVSDDDSPTWCEG